MSYCSYCKTQEEGSKHRWYHDKVYGRMFGRLIMEISQAGLSWDIVLNKYDGIKSAYSDFDIEKISEYKEEDILSLMKNKDIIRHELKIRSAVFNANKILKIQEEFGTFKTWLLENNQNSIENWTKLFKKNFKFVGKEIVKEFLISNAIIEGAHDKTCSLYKK